MVSPSLLGSAFTGLPSALKILAKSEWDKTSSPGKKVPWLPQNTFFSKDVWSSRIIHDSSTIHKMQLKPWAPSTKNPSKFFLSKLKRLYQASPTFRQRKHLSIHDHSTRKDVICTKRKQCERSNALLWIATLNVARYTTKINGRYSLHTCAVLGCKSKTNL